MDLVYSNFRKYLSKTSQITHKVYTPQYRSPFKRKKRIPFGTRFFYLRIKFERNYPKLMCL
jgi:hypothetical protein